jgi:hypothetical protein
MQLVIIVSDNFFSLHNKQELKHLIACLNKEYLHIQFMIKSFLIIKEGPRLKNVSLIMNNSPKSSLIIVIRFLSLIISSHLN